MRCPKLNSGQVHFMPLSETWGQERSGLLDMRDGLPIRWALAYSDSSMDDRIMIDPAICHGKPIIRVTRTPVSIVVGSLAGGMSFQEVQREYDLTMEDIRAALKFAGELVDQEQHHPLPT
jgi:uncharacterized protein (DUF433 family)